MESRRELHRVKKHPATYRNSETHDWGWTLECMETGRIHSKSSYCPN
ncbi:hypothetical protein MICAG_4530001 [Microcystis aeruginosa PCC 9808]|uniref:Uncharacterized protein n=1 Tax=Microcystis aeruginosa PCC 9808 TaxID=1160284 RepID=I4I1W3_MICAE|nr:hypothetical protein MICAG_4530001 [Microcystis aeruginosa PCC 9808]